MPQACITTGTQPSAGCLQRCSQVRSLSNCRSCVAARLCGRNAWRCCHPLSGRQAGASGGSSEGTSAARVAVKKHNLISEGPEKLTRQEKKPAETRATLALLALHPRWHLRRPGAGWRGRAKLSSSSSKPRRGQRTHWLQCLSRPHLPVPRPQRTMVREPNQGAPGSPDLRLRSLRGGRSWAFTPKRQ